MHKELLRTVPLGPGLAPACKREAVPSSSALDDPVAAENNVLCSLPLRLLVFYITNTGIISLACF